MDGRRWAERGRWARNKSDDGAFASPPSHPPRPLLRSSSTPRRRFVDETSVVQRCCIGSSHLFPPQIPHNCCTTTSCLNFRTPNPSRASSIRCPSVLSYPAPRTSSPESRRLPPAAAAATVAAFSTITLGVCCFIRRHCQCDLHVLFPFPRPPEHPHSSLSSHPPFPFPPSLSARVVAAINGGVRCPEKIALYLLLCVYVCACGQAPARGSADWRPSAPPWATVLLGPESRSLARLRPSPSFFL